ncbi:MAG: ROK family protein [Actinomycetota bacterium]
MDTPARRDVGLTVGLDIGGTKILGVLLGPDGVVQGSLRLPTTRGVTGVVATSASVVRALTGGAGVPGNLAGIGVGVPGVVDPTTGTVAHGVNLGFPGAPTPLAQLLSAELGGVQVQVENDLNVAALGAAHAIGTSADLAFLALGTGLAAGLLLDGRLRRGAFGAAGEIGHLPYVADGPLCACGQRGCLELYASGASLDARWPGSGNVPAPVALFSAAAAGDPGAVALRDDFAAAVAAGIRILVLTTDVARVVLGGGVSELGPPLLEAVVRALSAQAAESEFLAALRIGERVGLAPLGIPVAAIGAALLVRRSPGH